MCKKSPLHESFFRSLQNLLLPYLEARIYRERNKSWGRKTRRAKSQARKAEGAAH